MATAAQKREFDKKFFELKRDVPDIEDSVLRVMSYIWARLESDVVAEKAPKYASQNAIARLAGMSLYLAKKKLTSARVPFRRCGNRYMYNTKLALDALTK